MRTLRELNFQDIALPWHEQLVMRVYVGPFMANSSDSPQNRRLYEAYSHKIIALAEEVPLDQHKVRVLVPPQAGLLEDTRSWSISMILEHLILVDMKAKEIILKLSLGKDPDFKMSIGSVKPIGRWDARETFERYKAFVPSYLDEIEEALAKSKLELTEVHPIFGPFNALQWQWSMATRTALRYRQLINVRKGLCI